MGAMALLLCLQAREIRVDHAAGEDAQPGTKDKPFKTIAHAVKQLCGGDAHHLDPAAWIEKTGCATSFTPFAGEWPPAGLKGPDGTPIGYNPPP